MAASRAHRDAHAPHHRSLPAWGASGPRLRQPGPPSRRPPRAAAPPGSPGLPARTLPSGLRLLLRPSAGTHPARGGRRFAAEGRWSSRPCPAPTQPCSVSLTSQSGRVRSHLSRPVPGRPAQSRRHRNIGSRLPAPAAAAYPRPSAPIGQAPGRGGTRMLMDSSTLLAQSAGWGGLAAVALPTPGRHTSMREVTLLLPKRKPDSARGVRLKPFSLVSEVPRTRDGCAWTGILCGEEVFVPETHYRPGMSWEITQPGICPCFGNN